MSRVARHISIITGETNTISETLSPLPVSLYSIISRGKISTFPRLSLLKRLCLLEDPTLLLDSHLACGL